MPSLVQSAGVSEALGEELPDVGVALADALGVADGLGGAGRRGGTPSCTRAVALAKARALLTRHQ